MAGGCGSSPAMGSPFWKLQTRKTAALVAWRLAGPRRWEPTGREIGMKRKTSWSRILSVVLLGGIVLPVLACGSSSPSSGTPSQTSAARGKSLYVSLGCSICHSSNGSPGKGPTWQGLYGSTVTLTSGQKVTADNTYLHNSIENPNLQIVDGFKPNIMTTVVKPGSVSKADAQALIAYIKTLEANNQYGY
jgi:mono/diheme cytochrome c family protein